MGYTNTGAKVVMSSKTIKLQATAHLSARYDLLCCKLAEFSGELSRDRYISVNLDASMRNIRDGLVPDGQGCYRGKVDADA